MSHPKLIVMSGLPGSGKSTIAEGVASKLGLPLFSVDPIESAIVESGVEKSFETGLAAYLVAKVLAAEQIKLGSSVIIDAVNAEEEGKNVWRDLAKECEVELLIIECSLSDAVIHQKRIESRVRNLHGISEVSWEKVEARREKYTEWKEPTLELDSLNPVDSNLQKAIQYIQSK